MVFKFQTWFIGESGTDTGGITRELWRLLGHDVMHLCEGNSAKMVFRHSSAKVLVSIRCIYCTTTRSKAPLVVYF